MWGWGWGSGCDSSKRIIISRKQIFSGIWSALSETAHQNEWEMIWTAMPYSEKRWNPISGFRWDFISPRLPDTRSPQWFGQRCDGRKNNETLSEAFDEISFRPGFEAQEALRERMNMIKYEFLLYVEELCFQPCNMLNAIPLTGLFISEGESSLI